MKTKTVMVKTFGRHEIPMVLPADGEQIEFNTDVDHGDFKTACVFPDRWPTIKKGTRVKCVGHMQNLYGVFVRVEHNGSRYDVDSTKIVGLHS